MGERQHYQVNEIFDSIQGEGRLAGTPSTFIRLQGCLVGCEWCDTRYTWLKGGTRMTVDSIFNQVHLYHVVVTGGEPTLYDLDSLFRTLRWWDHSIQLETSGQQDLKGNLKPDWLTISPKHRLGYKVPTRLAQLANEFKFVVDANLSLRVLEAFSVSFPHVPIVLMPEGTPPKEEWIRLTLEWLHTHPHWYYSDRLQYRLG